MEPHERESTINNYQQQNYILKASNMEAVSSKDFSPHSS